MNQQTLGADEKEALELEIQECERGVDQARSQDSTTMKKIQKHFSPEEDSL